MKNKIYLLLCIIGIGSLQAQYIVTLDATIVDQKTNAPIPYVNVGFIDQAIGTVTDQNGHLLLEYDEQLIPDSAVLRISMLGYETKEFTIAQLFEKLSNTDRIYLTSSVYELDEAKVIAQKQRKISLNTRRGIFNLMGYWKDKKGLGGEIATLIKVKQQNVALRSLHFKVKENESDSLRIRINIYEKDHRKPGKKLISENIYHTVKKGEESVNLKPYGIIVNNDFIVGIELVKVYGDDIGFAVMASSKGKSYLRDVSQAKWKTFNNTGMAFTVEASFPYNGRYKNRKRPKELVLYWDTSLSMRTRALDKEISFLKQYIATLRSGTIRFVPFSNTIKKEQIFSYKQGKAPELISHIKQQQYKGASNFSTLFKEKEIPDTYLVFSDGKASYGAADFTYDTPIFFVNSQPNADRKKMQEICEKSDGFLLDIATYDLQLALQQINKDIDDLRNFSDEHPAYVIGHVFSKNQQPIQGCIVSVQGKLTQAITDAKGSFKIKAQAGQKLTFDYLGMAPQEYTVTENEQHPTITFTRDIAMLDQIDINVAKDIADLPEIEIQGVKTQKKAIGFATYTLDNKNFLKSAIYLSDIIRNRFPGVQIFGFGDDARYIIRGVSSINNQAQPMFVVDGAQFFSPPLFLQPQMIQSISVISGLAGTARYGNAGRGGVFIIKTKNAVKYKTKVAQNSLLAMGNDYVEKVRFLDPTSNRPAYLNKFTKNTSLADAQATFEQLLPNYLDDIPFFLNTSTYFKRWNPRLSHEIISTIAEIAPDNPQALRTLAYQLESENKHKEALEIYEQLFDIEHKYSAQIYLDIARTYLKNQRYPEALKLYKIILTNQKAGIDFTALIPQAESQLQRFSNLYRFQIPREEMPETFLTVKSPPVLIVLDWSSPQSQFEIQFVNPKKKYFTWFRSFEADPETINMQVKNGVLSKQFIIDHTLPGKWMVNLTSYAKDGASKNPGVLKYTIYTHYGLPEETKEVRFIQLHKHQKKVTLDQFNVPVATGIGLR